MNIFHRLPPQPQWLSDSFIPFRTVVNRVCSCAMRYISDMKTKSIQHVRIQFEFPSRFGLRCPIVCLSLIHRLSFPFLSRYSHGLYNAILSLSLTTYIFASHRLLILFFISFLSRLAVVFVEQHLLCFSAKIYIYIFSNIKIYTTPCIFGVRIALVISYIFFLPFFCVIVLYWLPFDMMMMMLFRRCFYYYFLKFRLNKRTSSRNSSRTTNKTLHPSIFYFAKDLFSFFLRDFFFFIVFLFIYYYYYYLLCFCAILASFITLE